MDLDALVAAETISPAMSHFLMACITARKNLVVCGAPTAGRAAVVSAIANASPKGERVVSVEEAGELAMDRTEWISLRTTPGVTRIADVLAGALDLRPDRLVVHSVRGDEATDLLYAMSGRQDGVVVTVAGEGAEASLLRFAVLAHLGAPSSSIQAIRNVVSCAVDFVLHVALYADGVSRVAGVSEIRGTSATGFVLTPLFEFSGKGFSPCGVVPSFYAELEARGISVDASIFSA